MSNLAECLADRHGNLFKEFKKCHFGLRLYVHSRERRSPYSDAGHLVTFLVFYVFVMFQYWYILGGYHIEVTSWESCVT